MTNRVAYKFFRLLILCSVGFLFSHSILGGLILGVIAEMSIETQEAYKRGSEEGKQDILDKLTPRDTKK